MGYGTGNVKGAPLLLVGCGILRKEIAFLIEKNHWPLELALVDSALHVDFERLEKALRGSLRKAGAHGREAIVFYGCCHPRMDEILEQARTFRTPGQNCVEIVLGRERFMAELTGGAFFLFEDWARHWDRVTDATFGPNRTIMREIFQGTHRYILALRTSCSGDFSAEAQEVARQIGLSLRWTDVALDHLEAVLRETIERKRRERR